MRLFEPATFLSSSRSKLNVGFGASREPAVGRLRLLSNGCYWVAYPCHTWPHMLHFLSVRRLPLKFMNRKVFQTFALLLEIVLLLGAWGTAQAVTPMAAAGGLTSCSVESNGVLRCWGDDSYGQLGQGKLLQSNTPLRVGIGYLTTPTQTV